MENKEVRNQSLDLIKTIAMLGVIALHTTYQYMSPGSFGIADIFYETAVISIPLFFMTSGYLLVPRKNISASYVGRKIWGIIRFVCTMVFLFWLWNAHKRGIHFDSLFRNLLGALFQEGEQYIFWYFGAMIILYVLLPILCKLYEKYLSSYILLLLIIMLCANMISSTN
ncbi:MAG: acyltransferase family protein [Paraprevotella sp.]|nr:acyltransferase family protein [Paraprevotella sp.]